MITIFNLPKDIYYVLLENFSSEDKLKFRLICKFANKFISQNDLINIRTDIISRRLINLIKLNYFSEDGFWYFIDLINFHYGSFPSRKEVTLIANLFSLRIGFYLTTWLQVVYCRLKDKYEFVWDYLLKNSYDNLYDIIFQGKEIYNESLNDYDILKKFRSLKSVELHLHNNFERSYLDNENYKFYRNIHHSYYDTILFFMTEYIKRNSNSNTYLDCIYKTLLFQLEFMNLLQIGFSSDIYVDLNSVLDKMEEQTLHIS
jgi:hypothetical protein